MNFACRNAQSDTLKESNLLLGFVFLWFNMLMYFYNQFIYVHTFSRWKLLLTWML